MSDIFRLDEVLMPLLDKWNNDLEDLAEDIGAEYDDLYDLLDSPHPEEGEFDRRTPWSTAVFLRA